MGRVRVEGRSLTNCQYEQNKPDLGQLISLISKNPNNIYSLSLFFHQTQFHFFIPCLFYLPPLNRGGWRMEDGDQSVTADFCHSLISTDVAQCKSLCQATVLEGESPAWALIKAAVPFRTYPPAAAWCSRGCSIDVCFCDVSFTARESLPWYLEYHCLLLLWPCFSCCCFSLTVRVFAACVVFLPILQSVCTEVLPAWLRSSAVPCGGAVASTGWSGLNLAQDSPWCPITGTAPALPAPGHLHPRKFQKKSWLL